ncbi:hypothetical protein D3272_26165 [Lichenibacterium ramalinae]|uniref:Uncharacterized protein n=1 Tax=Lichenibacterium ramalinae TaxID=2316527 RepID=A0A4Q2R7F0_9HYPH|nr:hypothetical protein D3272_26165 [Lichenibacterium ramalinae]
MGGLGSGREARFRTVEGAFRLDLAGLFKGMPESGKGTATIGREGGRLCRSIERMEVDLDICGGSGSIRLRYEVLSRGDLVVMGDRLMLVSLPQPFGGRRWWATCPISGRRVKSLYLPAGALRFASREAYGLRYESQRMNPKDRALEMAQRVRRELGGEIDVFSHFPDRPLGMHQSRYERLRARGMAAEAASIAALRAWLDLTNNMRARPSRARA